MTSMTAVEVPVCDRDQEPDRLLAYRERFPILERTNYLISNSLGAVPAAVGPSLQSYFALWATRGVRAWEEGWWTMAADLGDLVAPLIGAHPGEVVFQPNVTLAHAVIFSAFDYGRNRNRIVTDAMHFPSILYLIDQQRRLGADVAIIPSDDGIAVDTERLIEAIDDKNRDRESLARAVQIGLYSRRRRDRRQGASSGGNHCHRRLPGCRHDPRRCSRSRDRRLHRRLLEVAMRRSGQRVRLG